MAPLGFSGGRHVSLIEPSVTSVAARSRGGVDGTADVTTACTMSVVIVKEQVVIANVSGIVLRHRNGPNA